MDNGEPMTLNQLMSTLIGEGPRPGAPRPIYGHNGHQISVYPLSVRMQGDRLFFIGREGGRKAVFVVAPKGHPGADAGLAGEKVPENVFGPGLVGCRCAMDHGNADAVRALFPFTRPVTLGLADSYGFGDPLGIANPAHLRALAGSHFKPVLAQQSVRELERTQRTAEEVLDAATWAALQEGYTGTFGADADHLKTPADIDRYAKVGFTMFTFDPGAYVVNEAANLPAAELRARAAALETGDLNLSETLARHRGRTIGLGDAGELSLSEEDALRAFVKYGGVITYAAMMYRHLERTSGSRPFEVELSVDETDIPTTVGDHWFVASELKRLGVKLVSLAPRFTGSMEKGVDYKGDLEQFAREYLRHAAVARLQGPYKLSIHSGSDKFSLYRVIGRLHAGPVHVKTAGTSYLEALRAAAAVDPAFAREVLDFSRGLYEQEKLSYHVSARLDRVPEGKAASDRRLLELFDEHDARQVFHVTFGKVLSSRDAAGKPTFRDRLMKILDDHEEEHYEGLVRHFRKHLEPFMTAAPSPERA
jgi:hypothetical protein